MTANEITKALLIAIPREFPNIRVWRQNTGGAVGMNTVRIAIGLLLKNRISEAIQTLKRPIAFGIVGGGDISGIIGPTSGRRLEIEVKAGRDKQSLEQQGFQGMITVLGGIYLIARDVDGCLAELRRWA